jgi:hypothetical protein
MPGRGCGARATAEGMLVVVRAGCRGSGGVSVRQETLRALQAAATVEYSGLVAP